jgi:hypothetical protein
MISSRSRTIEGVHGFDLVYAHVKTLPCNNRIALVKYREMGYSPTDISTSGMTDAEVDSHVAWLNSRLDARRCCPVNALRILLRLGGTNRRTRPSVHGKPRGRAAITTPAGRHIAWHVGWRTTPNPQ